MDKKTKNYILRIDAQTMEDVEKWAADEFRSVNGQLLYIISEALKKNRRLTKSATKEESKTNQSK